MTDNGFALSLNMLLCSASRQHMSLHNMAIMSCMFVDGDCEPLDIAQKTGMSKTHMYRQLNYLKAKGVVRRTGVRNDYYRQKIILWGLTEAGRRTVREWELSYRLQLRKLTEWNENLKVAGKSLKGSYERPRIK